MRETGRTEDRALARDGAGGRLFPGVFLTVALLAWGSLAGGDDGGRTEAPEMTSDIVFTIVYDNYAFDERLQTAWGFACVVRGLTKTILFDTGGDGRILLSNMAKSDIRPEQIDVVVLSHIHGDHTGGLDAFLRANPKVTVFVPRSFPLRFKEKARKAGATLVETQEPCEICEGVWTTGVLKDGVEEQGLYLRSGQGLIVMTGCAHPGIVRIAQAAGQHAETPPRVVLGGFHMTGASRRRIGEVIAGLKELGVVRVGPCHCSGKGTRRLMEEAFGDGYLPSGVGARIIFPNEAGE